MTQPLKGKTAIITGGAASIGLAITQTLHTAGANVVIAGRSLEKGASVAKILGQRALFVQTDISKDEDLAALVTETITTFGGVDILVNNACVYGDNGPATERSVWLDTLNVNLVSCAILGDLLRPYLKQSSGTIVNIGSISGNVPHIGRWAYPVSKAALKHLTKSQAVDYAQDTIRVLQLTLGHIWSDPISQMTAGDRAKADAVASTFNLSGRVAHAEEIGRVVLFAVSEDAAFMTGAEIPVDGGYGVLGPEQSQPLAPLFAHG